MNFFDDALTIYQQNIDSLNYGFNHIEWIDFWLNPRRLRGSDFLMRWSQGIWSETLLIDAVNRSQEFFAIPYGPSSVAPNYQVREFELYFERLGKAENINVKRPDLLIYHRRDQQIIEYTIQKIGGLKELPFHNESENEMRLLLHKALVAIECENSLWKAQQMPDFGSNLKPQKRLGGKLGLKKSVVLPTIIIKEEDKNRLLSWQSQNNKAIHIWHAFYDLAYGISLDDALNLVSEGFIEPTEQTFQAPGGTTTKKQIYKIYYHYGYPLGKSTEEPKLEADSIIDKNGHILPFVRFVGGKIELTPEVYQVLKDLDA